MLSFAHFMLAGALLGGPDAEDAVREMRRAFRRSDEPSHLQLRREIALAEAEAHDTSALAEARLEAYVAVERELVDLEQEHHRFVLRGVSDRDHEPRPGIDPLRALQETLLEQIGNTQNPASVKMLFDRALLVRHMPMRLRLAVAARSEVLRGERTTALLKTIRRTRRTTDVWVSLVAAEHLGPQAGPYLSEALEALEHPDATLRESAARTLAVLAKPAGIEPLVERLAVETGRTRQRMHEALQVLAGVPIHASADAWRVWLAGAGQEWLNGEHPLGRGKSDPGLARSVDTYHRVPLNGESILFVVDISRSMQKTLTTPGEPAFEGQESRLDRARTELLHALESLAPEQRFGIVVFGGELKRFHSGLLSATEENVARAGQWFNSLNLSLGTRLHDALELAFTLAGRDVEDVYWHPKVDTIYLVSDGHPVVASKADDEQAILNAVHRWNLGGRIMVHAIGLGDEAPVSFLQQLAADHGGQFVHEVLEPSTTAPPK